MEINQSALPPVGALPTFASLPEKTHYRDESGNVRVKTGSSYAFDLATDSVVAVTDLNEKCLLVNISALVELA